ncbi:MAG: hypothetical protein ABI846_09115 [Rudaea sp.]
MSRGPTPTEPYWTPLSREPLGWAQIGASLLRHLIPVIGTLWFGWSASQFGLLSVFNIAFSIACIAVVGVGASMLKASTSKATSAWARIEPWISLAVVASFVTVLLTAMFGWIIVVMAPEGAALFGDRRLWFGALGMVAAALPGVLAGLRADARSGLSDEQRKKRDQPRAGVLFFTGVIVFMGSGYAASWFGSWGLYPLMLLITVLLLLGDLRPDLMRELTRPANRLTDAQKRWKRMVDRL